MEDETRNHDFDLVNNALTELMKFFDTCQIFCTREEPTLEEAGKQTEAFSAGLGNWYARYGQIREWVDNGGVMHHGPLPSDEEDNQEN